LGKTIWDKTEVLWGCLEEQLGSLGKPLGTPWERDENQKKKKNIKSSPSKKIKKLDLS
jgi:hypothetical protein